MERRGVYRGIEDSIGSGAYSNLGFPHSYLSRSLRWALRSLRDDREVLIGRMVAVSALAGNSRIDVDSGREVQKELLDMIVSTIPYMRPSGSDAESERERAVELFNEVSDEMEELVARIAGKTAGKVDIESE